MEVPVRRSLAVIAITLSAALVACGGSSDKYSRAAYIDAAMANFKSSGAPITTKQAECCGGILPTDVGWKNCSVAIRRFGRWTCTRMENVWR